MRYRAVLVFGEPDSGKSYLATKLRDDYGYSVLSLDEAYVDFIKDKCANLYLPDLMAVISQHYRTILDKEGHKAWKEYVVAVAKERLAQDMYLVVEGYLLQPILKAVHSALSKTAKVTVINVRDRKYYVQEAIEQIVAD